MGRGPRIAVGGLPYHVLDRANGGIVLFRDDGDYGAFETVMTEACARLPIPVLAYCLMPSHWHLVLWPRKDGDLSNFMQWAILTHTQRWHAHRDNVGSGHVYQGRFKSFFIEEDEHLLTVCRYVERNPLGAGLVERAEAWRWSSLWRRLHPESDAGPPLADGPVPLPEQYLEWVNAPQTDKELKALRRCANRELPFGSPAWTRQMADRYQIRLDPAPRGRPPRQTV